MRCVRESDCYKVSAFAAQPHASMLLTGLCRWTSARSKSAPRTCRSATTCATRSSCADGASWTRARASRATRATEHRAKQLKHLSEQLGAARSSQPAPGDAQAAMCGSRWQGSSDAARSAYHMVPLQTQSQQAQPQSSAASSAGSCADPGRAGSRAAPASSCCDPRGPGCAHARCSGCPAQQTPGTGKAPWRADCLHRLMLASQHSADTASHKSASASCSDSCAQTQGLQSFHGVNPLRECRWSSSYRVAPLTWPAC